MHRLLLATLCLAGCANNGQVAPSMPVAATVPAPTPLVDPASDLTFQSDGITYAAPGEREPNDDWPSAQEIPAALIPAQIVSTLNPGDVDCYRAPAGVRVVVNGWWFSSDKTQVCVMGDGAGVVEATPEMMRSMSMARVYFNEWTDVYRFVVEAGDDPLHLGSHSERAELRYWPATNAGLDRHYKLRVMWPAGTAFSSNGVNMFLQFHAPTDIVGNPNLQMFVTPDAQHIRMMTTHGIGPGAHYDWAQDIANFQFDHWYTIDLHVVWSAGSDSLEEVTVDGTMTLQHAGGGNLYWTDSTMTATAPVYPKQGWYRGSVVSGTLGPDHKRSVVYESPLFSGTAPARYTIQFRYN